MATSTPIIKVLITMHPGMDTLDMIGPLEVLGHARHDKSDDASRAFEIKLVAATEKICTAQGVSIDAAITYEDAYSCLSEIDILIVTGGGTDEVIKSKSEPLGLIKAYSDLQKKDPKKERTLFGISTGALFLAHQGILSGLKATTHPESYAKFEKICSEVAQRDLVERCDVLEERYVVNNLRFELGDDIDANPYIRRKSDAWKPARVRKGSDAWQDSNRRRESIARRASIRLGGLRVMTSGGTACGLDGSLYLIGIMVSSEAAAEVERTLMYEWKKGVVVDGVDV